MQSILNFELGYNSFPSRHRGAHFASTETRHQGVKFSSSWILELNMKSCVFVALTTFLTFFGVVVTQKISQGGSDWYLRFRSERDLDRPETLKLSVKSVVSHCYAVTTVQRDIFNPANVSQGRIVL